MSTINITFLFQTQILPFRTSLYLEFDSPLIAGSPITILVEEFDALSLPTAISLEVIDMSVVYAPTSPTQVQIEIDIPAGGIEWSVLAPIVSGPVATTIPFNQIFLFDLPDPRIITTNFLLGNLLSFGEVAAPNSLVVQSGASTAFVEDVPGSATISIEPFCIHPDSMIHTTQGLKKLGDLKGSQNVELIDFEGKPIKMLHNAEFAGSVDFVKYSKGSIGPNVPDCDLYMTEGHPIMHNGRERTSKSMLNGKTIQLVENPVDFTYAPVTEKRTFVMINNVPVCTWALSDLVSFAQKAGVYYRLS
jgi:hypothetical protein